MLAHLSVENTNTARLLSISSSCNNFTLRSFLSATETVMVEESREDVEEGLFNQLRHAHNFQVVTKLNNFITSNQQAR